MLYRVVLTCWEYGKRFPYLAYLTDEKQLSLFPTEEEAMKSIKSHIKNELVFLNDLKSNNPKKKIPVYDSDGIIVSYEYPFRADFDGDDSGIIRLWDGDDYQNVTAYNIYEIDCDSDNLYKCSYYKYRGFKIYPNKKLTCFKVETSYTQMFELKTLDAALKKVDSYLTRKQQKERK